MGGRPLARVAGRRTARRWEILRSAARPDVGDPIGKMGTTVKERLTARITSRPEVCGGRPCIRDTRIEIAVILDGLAEGMTEAEIRDHYPQLTTEDGQASLAYAADLAHECVWKSGTNT